MKRILTLMAAGGMLAGTALAPAAPAVAQGYYPPPPAAYPEPYVDRYEEEIVVDGRYRRRLPDDVATASQRVSYADLDLYYAADRRELRRRVSLTARYLCDRLGESEFGSVAPSCRDAATRDALRRVGTVAEGWAPRGTAWVAPPRWRGAYPVEWERRYR